MKRITLLGILLIGASTFAHAELKIPRSVYKMDQLSEAKTKAAEENKPLIFVYTDPGTT